MKEQPTMRVTYAAAVHGKEERQAVLDLLDAHETMLGKRTVEFEQRIAERFGKAYGVMVNSGTSANFLAIKALDLPEGSEIITPILTFTSCVAPILQNGHIPVLIDAEIGNYQIDISKIEAAISPKTKAMLIPNLLGNLPNMKMLRDIARAHDLVFIEDSCDTLGATFDGESTGTYSDISTTSFYGSHIITAAGGGGMLCINDATMRRRLRVLRGWGRSSAADETEDIESRFQYKVDGIPFDAKFIFEELALNFLPLEISSAFGLEQLKKLPAFTAIRQKNFADLKDFFSGFGDYFILPQQHTETKTAWLAFPLTITENAPFTRLEIVKHLEGAGIQTRPLFSGNILRHPAYRDIKCRTPYPDYPVADNVMKNSFLIGCHHGMEEKHIQYVKTVFTDFMKTRV